MPRQVQIIISRELFDNEKSEFTLITNDAGSKETGGNSNRLRSRSHDASHDLAERIMKVLQVMRKPHCVMPFMIKGDDHIIIQFRSQQKHLGDTIHALQGMGIGIVSGTRIDVSSSFHEESICNAEFVFCSMYS